MSVDFCDARQGGGAYGKTPAARPFTVVLFCSHVLSGLSPDSVDKPSVVMRESSPLAAAPATERSERVSEEAEESRELHVLLTRRRPIFSLLHEALFNLPALMPTLESQYTLRYRYVTGSGLRPETP